MKLTEPTKRPETKEIPKKCARRTCSILSLVMRLGMKPCSKSMFILVGVVLKIMEENLVSADDLDKVDV